MMTQLCMWEGKCMRACTSVFFWSFILSSYLWYNRYQQISLSHRHAHTHFWCSASRLLHLISLYCFLTLSACWPAAHPCGAISDVWKTTHHKHISTTETDITPNASLTTGIYPDCLSSAHLLCLFLYLFPSLTHTLSLHSLVSSYSDHSRYYWGAFKILWNNQVCPHPIHLSLQTDPLKISPVYLIIIH